MRRQRKGRPDEEDWEEVTVTPLAGTLNLHIYCSATQKKLKNILKSFFILFYFQFYYILAVTALYTGALGFISDFSFSDNILQFYNNQNIWKQ